MRGRLTQVKAELELSDSRSKRLFCADRSNRRVLTPMLAARRLDMQRAVFSLEQVRNEQRLYTEYAGADWARRDLEELIPVREATSVLAQAEVQFAITSLQVEANDARLADLQLERQTWMRLDAEPLFGGDATVDSMGSLEIIAALEREYATFRTTTCEPSRSTCRIAAIRQLPQVEAGEFSLLRLDHNLH